MKEILSPVNIDFEARERSYLQSRLKEILSPVDVDFEDRERSYLQPRLKEILSPVDIEARRRILFLAESEPLFSPRLK